MKNSGSIQPSWKEYVEKNKDLRRRAQQLLKNRLFGHFYANQDRLHGK